MAELRNNVEHDARAVRILCDAMPQALRHRVLSAIRRTTPRIERQSLYNLFGYIFEDDSDSSDAEDSDAVAQAQGSQQGSGEDLLKVVSLSDCLSTLVLMPHTHNHIELTN